MRKAELALCLVGLLLGGSLVVVAGAFPVTVIDDRGEAIVIEALPERIITVGALYAEIILGLGAGDRLIAVAESPENPAGTEGLPTVGSTFAPNVELIVGFGPDLVLGASDWGGERGALEAAGIPVLTTPVLASIPDIFLSIREVGTAIGKQEEADRLIGRMAERIVEAETQALGRPKIRAAFLYASTPDAPPYAAGAGAIENELILRAGGENVFADIEGFPQVGFEEILARDPEVIFTAPSQIENLTGHPLLQGVAAVRGGRVLGIGASQVTSTRVVEALLEVIRALHGFEP